MTKMSNEHVGSSSTKPTQTNINGGAKSCKAPKDNTRGSNKVRQTKI